MSYPASSTKTATGLYNKWYIYNVNSALPPPATSYFIYDATKIAASVGVNVLHTSVASGDGTLVNNAGAINNAGAVVFFTPTDLGASVPNKPLGVYWAGTNWDIFNEDGSTFTSGVKFNVLFFPGQIP